MFIQEIYNTKYFLLYLLSGEHSFVFLKEGWGNLCTSAAVKHFYAEISEHKSDLETFTSIFYLTFPHTGNSELRFERRLTIFHKLWFAI